MNGSIDEELENESTLIEEARNEEENGVYDVSGQP